MLITLFFYLKFSKVAEPFKQKIISRQEIWIDIEADKRYR